MKARAGAMRSAVASRRYTARKPKPVAALAPAPMDELWDARDAVVEEVRWLMDHGYPPFAREHVRQHYAPHGIDSWATLRLRVERGIKKHWNKKTVWWDGQASKLDLKSWIALLAEVPTLPDPPMRNGL